MAAPLGLVDTAGKLSKGAFTHSHVPLTENQV